MQMHILEACQNIASRLGFTYCKFAPASWKDLIMLQPNLLVAMFLADQKKDQYIKNKSLQMI